MAEDKKIDRCKYAHHRFNGDISCIEAGMADDKVVPTDEAKCETCEKYKSRYIEYPITIDSIDVEPINTYSWRGNPAMLVPQLNKIIYGCGSWWHRIKSEKELREITDGDINNTWYVKMAHQMIQQRRKSSIELKEGDRFQQAWKGCKEPMWFKVLSINRLNNSLCVEYHSYNGDMHEEKWNDLDVTESAFDVGEYKMIEDKED